MMKKKFLAALLTVGCVMAMTACADSKVSSAGEAQTKATLNASESEDEETVENSDAEDIVNPETVESEDGEDMEVSGSEETESIETSESEETEKKETIDENDAETKPQADAETEQQEEVLTKMPANSLFSPGWVTEDGNVILGSVAVVKVNDDLPCVGITAYHFLNVFREVDGMDLPEYIQAGVLFDVDHPNEIMLAEVSKVWAMPNAEGLAYGKDLAAFEPNDYSQLTVLPWRKDPVRREKRFTCMQI